MVPFLLPNQTLHMSDEQRASGTKWHHSHPRLISMHHTVQMLSSWQRFFIFIPCSLTPGQEAEDDPCHCLFANILYSVSLVLKVHHWNKMQSKRHYQALVMLLLLLTIICQSEIFSCTSRSFICSITKIQRPLRLNKFMEEIWHILIKTYRNKTRLHLVCRQDRYRKDRLSLLMLIEKHSIFDLIVTGNILYLGHDQRSRRWCRPA